MTEFASVSAAVLASTVRDVLPIAIVIAGFQLFVLRRRIPHLRRVLLGFLYVLLKRREVRRLKELLVEREAHSHEIARHLEELYLELEDTLRAAQWARRRSD